MKPRGGPIEPQKWGVSTKKGNKVYLHIVDCPEDELIVDFGKLKLASASFYKDKSPAKFFESKRGDTICLAS